MRDLLSIQGRVPSVGPILAEPSTHYRMSNFRLVNLSHGGNIANILTRHVRKDTSKYTGISTHQSRTTQRIWIILQFYIIYDLHELLKSSLWQI